MRAIKIAGMLGLLVFTFLISSCVDANVHYQMETWISSDGSGRMIVALQANVLPSEDYTEDIIMFRDKTVLSSMIKGLVDNQEGLSLKSFIRKDLSTSNNPVYVQEFEFSFPNIGALNRFFAETGDIFSFGLYQNYGTSTLELTHNTDNLKAYSTWVNGFTFTHTVHLPSTIKTATSGNGISRPDYRTWRFSDIITETRCSIPGSTIITF